MSATHLSKGQIEVKNAGGGGASALVGGGVCKEAEESVIIEGAIDEFNPVAEQPGIIAGIGRPSHPRADALRVGDVQGDLDLGTGEKLRGEEDQCPTSTDVPDLSFEGGEIGARGVAGDG
jgi:hypothetical protein